MSNNKDFVVNGPVAIGKDTKVTVGSISAGTVDLSTGNYFTDTPTGDYTYTFANAGDVQAFQIQATGGSEAVAETFSTTLYTGNGATQTIDNGLDLSGDGGLVWVKDRSFASDHGLFDTERGEDERLRSNTTNASTTNVGWITSFNSNGFGVGSSNSSSGSDYVSWSFKKQTKFFDIVTYTGDGVGPREIAHNLGTTVGALIIKRTDDSGNWIVYHRGVDATAPEEYVLFLEKTNARSDLASIFRDTAPTSTHFTVGSTGGVNASGATYVAYLFAHDTASDGLIQCGSYTGNGSTDGPEINLGWQPQWILVKCATAGGAAPAYGWYTMDTVRGMDGVNDTWIEVNSSNAESTATYSYVKPEPTGFKISSGQSRVNTSGETYIYMAIRSASAPAITWPTNIEWTGGSTPSTPAEGETDVYTFTTDDGGTTYTGIQSIDNAS